MIPTEDEGHRALCQGLETAFMEFPTHCRDLGRELTRGIAERDSLPDRRGDVAAVLRIEPQLSEMLDEVGDAKGRRTHVDAASSGSQIERDTNYVDRGAR